MVNAVPGKRATFRGQLFLNLRPRPSFFYGTAADSDRLDQAAFIKLTNRRNLDRRFRRSRLCDLLGVVRRDLEFLPLRPYHGYDLGMIRPESRIQAQYMIGRTREEGRPMAIEALCNAVKSPPASSTAEPSKVEIHRKGSMVGINMTPRANSRTVRPLEIRAMNMPKNGHQEIRQPAYHETTEQPLP